METTCDSLNEVVVKGVFFVYRSNRLFKPDRALCIQQETGFQHQIAGTIFLFLSNNIKVEKRLFRSPFIKQAITKQVKDFCTFNFPPNNSKVFLLLP